MTRSNNREHRRGGRGLGEDDVGDDFGDFIDGKLEIYYGYKALLDAGMLDKSTAEITDKKSHSSGSSASTASTPVASSTSASSKSNILVERISAVLAQPCQVELGASSIAADNAAAEESKANKTHIEQQTKTERVNLVMSLVSRFEKMESTSSSTMKRFVLKQIVNVLKELGETEEEDYYQAILDAPAD